jgi:hypothetical protein
MALEKAVKSPLFPLNLRLLSQKLKFWESLVSHRFTATVSTPPQPSTVPPPLPGTRPRLPMEETLWHTAHSKVWFNTPQLCCGWDNTTLTEFQY